MSEHIVKHHLKDKYLLMILFCLIIISSSLLIGLCVGDPFYLELSRFDSINDYQYCTSKYQMSVYCPLILSTRFSLLLLTTICAYKIRKIPDLFNETRQLVFTIYNLLFLSITLPAIDLTMSRGKDITMIAYGICVLMICILTTLIMFIPKIILVIQMDQKKERSNSTFLFNENTSSSSINNHFHIESSIETNENPSILKERNHFKTISIVHIPRH
jgi:hypothetical protein